MFTLADYERWKAKQQQSNVGAAQVVLGSTDASPDEVAGDINLANEFGKTTGNPVPPVPLVKEYRNVFQAAIERERTKAVLSNSPRLTEWLRNPENAAVARDDLEGLSWWETGLGAAGNAIGRGVRRVPQSYNQWLAQGASQRAIDQRLGLGEILADETAIRDRSGSTVANKGIVGPFDLFAAGSRYLTSRLSSVFGGDQEAAAAQYQRQAGEIAKRIASIPMSPAGERFKQTFANLGQSGDIAADLGEFVTSVAADPSGFLAFLTETAVESAPSIAAAAGVGVATRSPAAAAVALGLNSAAIEAGVAPVEFFNEKGIDVSTPEGAMRAISDPALMREAAQRGVIRGLIIGAMDGLSGGVAGRQLAASPIGNMALQAVTQALMGSAGEAGAQVAAGQQINIAEIIVEGLAEFVTAPIEVGGVGGRAFIDGQRKARDAQARRALFEEISGQAASSALRARLPDKFRQFVEQATANGPVENVYIPAGEFASYFQSIGVDPFVLVDELDGMTRSDLEVALAGGGDLQIPTATYAAKIAGSEHDAFLMENMRFDPDAFTAREAAEFNARAQEALEEAWEIAEAIRLENEELRSFEQEIYDTMVSRLREAGRSTDVATTEATLYPAFYRVMAERSGLTVEEFMRRYPLPQVRGELPQGIQFRDTDVLNRTLAEARARRAAGLDKRGPTLLEFIAERGGINDPGGELRARDAEVVRRGPGKKTLRLRRSAIRDGMSSLFGRDKQAGYGFDDAARAAIEAGYLADDPIANEYRAAMAEGREVPDIGRALLAAIDRELAGEVQYAGEASAQNDRNAELDAIEAYLSSLGVSLDDSDAAIRQAVEADQSGRMYAQDSAPGGFLGDVQSAAIDAILSGKGHSGPIVFPTVPVVLRALGIKETPVAIAPSVVWKAVDKHGMTGEQVKAALDGLADPIMVFDSLTTSDGLVALVEVPGEAKPVVVAVHPNERAGRIEISRIASIHRKDSPRAIIGWMEQGLTRYINKRKADAWVRPAGLYLPMGGSLKHRQGRKILQHRDVFKIAGPKLFQSGDVPGVRGLIQFPAGGVGNGDTVIRLFEAADLSTMLHESGHYFLTVLRDLGERGEASAAGDMDVVKQWWRSNAGDVAKDASRVMTDVQITAEDVIAAIDNGTTGDVMKDAAVDVGMQEQWARAFEAYLMEGKAPSADLRGVFEKFRAWLISVYRRLAGLNVTVSDDIRAVFDRMLATDAEIEQAKAEAGDAGPLFPSAEAMGLTPDEYAAFLKLRAQAEDEARARLLREVMAPIKRAQEAWYREERARVREEVERQVNAYPFFRAIEWMGNRRWFGEGQPEDMPDIRLSKDILVDRYGEGVLKTLPRGKQTVYAVEGGIDPDDAAGWFGFDSGDEMIRAMERAPKRTEAIDAETDRLMNERHGDPLNDGSVEAEALDAVHTDKRGQWIAAELKAVVEIAGQGEVLTAKEARASARQAIAQMRVRDAMNANRFLSAERKAAEEAARLGAMLARERIWMDNARRRIASKARAAIREEGTPEAVAGQIEQANRSTANYNETVARLVDAKRRQLLNHAFYMEARKVADEVEKAERFIARLTKKSVRERIAGAGRRENAQVDYLAAIDELLHRYDFRRLSGAAEQRRGALAAFIEGMREAGRENELAIPDAVLESAGRKPYKTLPVEELRGVIDSLKNLEHIALRWDKLIDAQQQRELEAVVSDIVAAFEANVPKRPPGRVGTRGEALRSATRQFLDLVLNAGTILREIDGFKDLGPAYRHLKAPIDEAMNRLIVRKQKAAADLDALYAVYSADERRRMAVREHMPELGYALSKWERIAVALNTGNAGNYQRLTDPRVRGSLTEAQVRAVLATLDERDANFVQSVWDYLETFRADIGARERRTTGVEPNWVEPQPVTIAGKELRGGYYPIKYDPRLSSLARDDQAQELAQSLQAGRFGKAQTRNGHTKERAQSSGRDVELDMSVLHRHVNQVIYDLELSEPVANSWRILQNGQVRASFIEAGKQADFDALEIWLKDVAEGELRSADLVGRAARTLKSNFTAAKLAFNLTTVAMQVTGLAQTMVVVGKKDFVRGLKASFRPNITAEISGKSPFMATRETTFNKDIFDFYNDPRTGPVASRWGDIKRDIIGPLSFWLMTKVQWYLVDVPTWMAGYQQGLRRFHNDEAKAVAHADAIVKRAQASGLFSDRSAVERGSVSRTARQNDVVRLFTALGSYMFAKFNVAYERSARSARTIRDEGLSLTSAQEALSWTLDMAFLFTLEAVLIAAIKGRLPDEDDDEDEGWMQFLARETAFSVMGTVPFVRDIASSMGGFEGGGAYGAITKEFAAPFQQAAQGDADAALVKSIINATGLATGLPATQMNRAVDAAWRSAEGEDVSPLEYLLGRMGK